MYVLIYIYIYRGGIDIQLYGSINVVRSFLLYEYFAKIEDLKRYACLCKCSFMHAHTHTNTRTQANMYICIYISIVMYFDNACVLTPELEYI